VTLQETITKAIGIKQQRIRIVDLQRVVLLRFRFLLAFLLQLFLAFLGLLPLLLADTLATFLCV